MPPIDIIGQPVETMAQSPFQISLDQHLEACRERYDGCLDRIESSIRIDGFDVELQFQHVRFDGDGEPKFDMLANSLADHAIQYCLSLRRRGSSNAIADITRLDRQARGLLRKFGTSGESGEMLLYFLLETVINAPQIVAKMDLKTNPNVEVHGSDGIHAKWNDKENLLDVYFGESKLEQSLSNALTNAFSSMSDFHEQGLRDHEFGLVTSHYKHLDEVTKSAVCRFLDRKSLAGTCRVNHACLVGYDWEEYKQLLDFRKRKLFISNFKDIYIQDTTRLAKLLTKRFENFNRPYLRFVFFFLPFRKVQEFRDAFNRAVS